MSIPEGHIDWSYSVYAITLIMLISTITLIIKDVVVVEISVLQCVILGFVHLLQTATCNSFPSFPSKRPQCPLLGLTKNQLQQDTITLT